MLKARCCDCKRYRDIHRVIMKRQNGRIDVVCRQCWILYDYAMFMVGPGSPHE